MMSIPDAPRIAIIGAGIAGMTCAQRLKASGLKPVLFDKSRGIGGRLSTRRTSEGLSFDHGAPYFTAQSPLFLDAVARSEREGSLRRWSPALSERPHPVPWYVGAPGMNACLKGAADGLDVRLGVNVSGIRREGATWRLVDDGPGQGAFYDYVVVTAPAPQTARLVGASHRLSEAVSRVEMTPCWTLMMAVSGPGSAEPDVYDDLHPDISLLVRNSSKPGREASPETWVAYASREWSLRHLEAEREEVLEKLLPVCLAILGQSFSGVCHAAAHRWRYAEVIAPAGVPFLEDETGTLLVAGDWCLGPRVECAFESGHAGAERITANLAARS